MTLQAPPPPPITPRQMNLMRVVTAMAWSDGELATEEVDLMLDRFSQLFAKTSEQHELLKLELREYMMQNLPLEELIPRLESEAERKVVLRLGYEVISASARTPDEPPINADEAEAYQKLVKLLNLPAETVMQIEAEAVESAKHPTGLVDKLIHELDKFING